MEASVLILIVENEAIVALDVGNALQDGGYGVRFANTGTEAIAMLDEDYEPFVGLVTDIRFGAGPDGWDVARRARELHPSIPVVYISIDSAADHASRGVPDSLMIQKPFAVMQVVTAISQLLNALPFQPSEPTP